MPIIVNNKYLFVYFFKDMIFMKLFLIVIIKKEKLKRKENLNKKFGDFSKFSLISKN